MAALWRLQVGVAVAVAGCGSSGSSHSRPTGTYTGTVANSQVFVAVVAGKSNIVVYVCDGRHGVGDLFSGRRRAGALVTHDSRGARVSATVRQRSATGTFSPANGSRALPFVAVTAQGRAGFYRGFGRLRGLRTTLSWVVLNDGRQRGALISAGQVTAAPTLSTTNATARLSGSSMVSATLISPTSVSRTGFGFGG